MTEPESYRIVRLDVDNVKKLRAVSITPDGNIVLVGGRNGQGKSSLLDAITWALGGSKAIPQDPIRHGAAKATIVADIGGYTIERVITARNTSLVVRDAEGNKVSSPQKILDGLCAKIAFDPSSFLRADSKEQDRLLRQAVGFDTSELDADRKQIYDRRTELNRAVDQARARFEGMDEYPDAPDKEVKFAEVYAELERRRAKVAAVQELGSVVAERATQLETASSAITDTEQAIAELEVQLADRRRRLDELRVVREAAEQAHQDAGVDWVKAKEVCPDPAEVERQLTEIEETNRKVRANQERAAAEAQLKNARKLAQDCTEAIEGIDARKQRMLEDAKFPVPGLAFNDAGPTLDGVPLDQASQAQLIRLSVAVGIAQNPKVRVLLVRDGSLMDRESLALLAQLAEEHDAQVWVEKVSEDGAGCSVVIEDGEILEAGAAAE